MKHDGYEVKVTLQVFTDVGAYKTKPAFAEDFKQALENMLEKFTNDCGGEFGANVQTVEATKKWDEEY